MHHRIRVFGREPSRFRGSVRQGDLAPGGRLQLHRRVVHREIDGIGAVGEGLDLRSARAPRGRSLGRSRLGAAPISRHSTPGVQLGEHLLYALVSGIQLQDELAGGDGTREEAVAGETLGGSAIGLDGLATLT
jgi:hypothetical protein